MVATVTRPTIQATWTAMVFLRLVVSVGRHGFPAFRGTIIGLWLAHGLNVVSVPPQWSRDGGSCPIPVASPSKWKNPVA